MCVGFLCGGEEAWLFTGLESNFPGGSERVLYPLSGLSVFQGSRILISSRF